MLKTRKKRTRQGTLMRRALRLLKEWQGALGQGDRPDLDSVIRQLERV